MNIINALILGIIEGITEFLPISSTAHLIVTGKLLNIPQTEYLKFFEVFIQSGAILAVIVIYFSYLLNNRYLFKKIIYSFIPTALVGFLLYKIIKNIFFESTFLIIGMLFIIGLVFILIEQLVKNKRLRIDKSISEISITEAVIIGFGQSLAVVPGVSRAGSVIITMMLLGFKREDAATYSFLLAVPTILVASLYDLYKMRDIVFASWDNTIYLLVGLTSSFVTAYFAIKWLISYLQKNTLIIFGIYRILLAIILLQIFI